MSAATSGNPLIQHVLTPDSGTAKRRSRYPGYELVDAQPAPAVAN